MEEFLTKYYSFLINLFEILAALVGVLVYRKYAKTSTKYFIWILVAIALVELIGGYTVYIERIDFLHPIRDFLKDTRFEDNNWFYTIFWAIGGPLAYACYFYKIIQNFIYKKSIKVIASLFILWSLIAIFLNFDFFFTGSFKSIQIFGAFLVLLSVILFLIELLQTERILSFYKSINFYIAATLFIWYLITTPIIFYDIYFSTKDMSYVILKSAIQLFSIIFMYSIFTIALLFCKPQNN